MLGFTLILIIISTNLIFNIIITVGLLHFFLIINIYDLLGVSKYFFIHCDNLNHDMSCNYYKINKVYKPINNNYFKPCLDLFKYKNSNNTTYYCISEIINTLYDFYDMNLHIIKDNNSILEQIDRLKPYHDSYNDLKSFIINNNPLHNTLT